MREDWEISWRDYYKILQVHELAEPEVIKGAYIKLAEKYHPDVNPDPMASQKMKDLNEAYNILGDTVKRSRYDSKYHQNTGVNYTRENPTSPKAKPVGKKVSYPFPFHPLTAYPNNIQLDDMKPGQTQTYSFILRNLHGRTPSFITPQWVEFINQTPLEGRLLKVDFAIHRESYLRYDKERIVVKVDNETAFIELSGKHRPRHRRRGAY